MASSGRPNVMLFIVHDLGTMLGCYGADPMLRTPCLDKLASEGVCFENHYATAPFCSPRRGGILTGEDHPPRQTVFAELNTPYWNSSR